MRLGLTTYETVSVNVSIHASVKDATRLPLIGFRALAVSIHASVKDATAAILNTKRFELVSIHASVKDATKDDITFIEFLLFQSTHL